jgi:cyclopropane fatty-acyl-phospholipid synthase-like methyltransferase
MLAVHSNPRQCAGELKLTPLQRLAERLSSSFVFRRSQCLWEANSKQWDLPLSKWDKLLTGIYLILKDYAAGLFPPKFEDQALAYQNEIDWHVSLPGFSIAQVHKAEVAKPFWAAGRTTEYLRDFSRLQTTLEGYGVRPGDRLLELGCGAGWMAEFLALAGYRVVGTTISHHDIPLANQRVAALKCKEIPGSVTFDLQFVAAPMESIDELPDCRNAFDAVYVYQALHHCFDWRKTLRAAANTLKSGGCLLIASEPNLLHTFISYRVARLDKAHEIGFSRTELVGELKAAGFSPVQVLRPKINDWVTCHWIVARKQ